MSQNDFQRKADQVRAIPLEVVLTTWDAVRDRRDKSRWRTERGPVSVTGAKFYNWHACQGGGGAIDLVMHLGGWDAKQAIEWLWRHYGGSQVTGKRAAAASDSTFASNPSQTVESHQDVKEHNARSGLRLPARCLANLWRVRHYLTWQRGLSVTILDSLIHAGKLYADPRGNAVFVMMAGKPNRPIGAELRGTGNRVWRGLAPGTCKNAGYFWIGNTDAKQIVLCESAIDAISCFQLQTQFPAKQLRGPCVCISTAGVRPTAPWLDPLLEHGYQIHCGFDDDKAGNHAGRQMIKRHPSIQRLLPYPHDWNDSLRNS
jgi:hypothetical protein